MILQIEKSKINDFLDFNWIFKSLALAQLFSLAIKNIHMPIHSVFNLPIFTKQ